MTKYLTRLDPALATRQSESETFDSSEEAIAYAETLKEKMLPGDVVHVREGLGFEFKVIYRYQMPLPQEGNPHYDVCHTIELCHHIEASSKERALAIAIDKGEVDARINLIKDWHVKGKGGNPMNDEEIDQVATKVAAKVLDEITPTVLDPAGRGMLLHFTEHEIEGAGLVVNEARARATPCNCFTYKGRDYCFSKGIIGMMSSEENPEQIAEYCKVGKTYEVKPGIKERFESFAGAAEEAHKKIEGIPKGERLVPWFGAMSEELEKRSIEV